jgi:hypothetical protein
LERVGKGKARKVILLVTDGKGKIAVGGKVAKCMEEAARELRLFAEVAIENDVMLNVVLVDGLVGEDWDVFADEVDDKSVIDERDDKGSDDEGEVEEADGEYAEADVALRTRLARARRLFSGWRVDDAFKRRKRVHAAAAANPRRAHVMPRDATLLRQTLLARLARVLGFDEGVSLSVASVEEDEPHVRVKKSTVKFHGVLDIGGVVEIPVKTYTRVGVATRPSGKKLSWATTMAQRRAVYVDSHRQFVVRFTEVEEEQGKEIDGGDGGMEGEGEEEDGEEHEEVQGDDIGYAYAYGPNIYPLEEEIACSLELKCEKELSVLAFVPQHQIPVKIFMSSVDVVLPMSGPEKCGPLRAMLHLVRAMLDLKCGAIARYASGKSNSKPELVYLWPVEETIGNVDDSSSDDDFDYEEVGSGKGPGRRRVFFLEMVKIPTRHDARDFPFASLQATIDSIPGDAKAHVDRFVRARDLDRDLPAELQTGLSQRVGKSKLKDISEEDVETEDADFDPAECCNPALERFFQAIVLRALEGGEGTSGLIEPPEWAKVLVNPDLRIRQANAGVAKSAAKALRNAFPLTLVEELQVKRRERTHVAIASGSQLDTSHLYPMPEVENEGEVDRERPYRVHADAEDADDIDYGEAIAFGDAPKLETDNGDALGDDVEMESEDGDDAMSTVTDCTMIVSRETPVADMKAMIRATRGLVALEMMCSVIYGLIRDGDVVLAAQCFIAFRKACARLGEVDCFNALLERLVKRYGRDTPQGNSASTFLGHLKSDTLTRKHLIPLLPKSPELRSRMEPSAEYMRRIYAAVETIPAVGFPDSSKMRGANIEDATSGLTGMTN